MGLAGLRKFLGSVSPHAGLLAVAVVFSACATNEKKSGGDSRSSDSDGGGRGDRGSGGSSGRDESAYVSANRVTLTNSLSNNPLTSQTVSKGKADALANKLQGGRDKKSLEGYVSAERLAGKGVNSVLGAAKKLAELEMEKGANREVSDEVKLDLALAAINSRSFAMAEYFLSELLESKNARVKAGAYNAYGVIALRDDRVPEAVEYFREALKASGNYRPAQLNLGFAALKGGDLATAKRMLGDMQSDWFVQYGLISVARLDGEASRAGDHCERVLKKEPQHKAALFNCGLVEFQMKKNHKEAVELVSKAGKARGGEAGWDERIQMMETKIDQEAARAKASAAAAKAAAAKPAAAKPAAAGGDAKPAAK